MRMECQVALLTVEHVSQKELFAKPDAVEFAQQLLEQRVMRKVYGEIFDELQAIRRQVVAGKCITKTDRAELRQSITGILRAIPIAG